jgi:hypothetical protein
VYLLPAATQFETSGSVTASNRSLQWREKVIEPLWESRTDHMIMYQLADKLGFGKELVKNYKMQKVKGMDEPVPEDILREINKSNWTIGYTGQSPERLKAHMRLMGSFDVKTLKAKGSVKDKETGYDIEGDYFGLPWPCYGTPELKHPGSPNLYDTTKHVMDGGGCFRANFGVEKDGVNLLAEDGSCIRRLGHHHRLSGDRPHADQEAGLVGRADAVEKAAAEGKNWKTDNSGGLIRVAMKNHGIHPFGNAKARAVVWNFPDPIPQHREADLQHAAGPGGQVPDARRQEGVLAAAHAVQVAAAEERAGQAAREIPADPHLRPAGRIRGRRRGDAVQPLAGGTAAGSLRRDQPEDGGRPQDQERRPRLAALAHRRAAERAGAGDGTRRPRHGVDALPLLRPLAGRGHAAVLPERRGAGGARRGGQHRHDLRLRQRDHDARDQDDDLQHRADLGVGPKRRPRWQE